MTTNRKTPRALRVLHLLNHLERSGNGIVNVAVDIATEQVKAGCIVAIASTGGGYVDLVQSIGVRHFNLPQRFPLPFLHGLAKFADIIREFRPDIVHCHMAPAALMAKAWQLKGRYGLVCHVHLIHQQSWKVMRIGDIVIPVSDAVADFMALRGTPRRKMAVVQNWPLHSPRTPSASECQPMELERPSIVCVAGLTENKGIAELISAFETVAADIPSAHLYLVGDGSERAMFERQAALSDAGARIHFEGFQRNPMRYLLSADVFALPSHHDTYPLVISEAREAGCAIVATNVDGIPELLDFGRAGVLVPPFDAGLLACAITRLLSDEQERLKWAARAKENLESRTVERMAERVCEVYERLLDSRGFCAKRAMKSRTESDAVETN